jgi:hypothetical protein
MGNGTATLANWFTEEEARRLFGGHLGDVYRDVLRTSCAPIYWFPEGRSPDLEKMHHGTVTIVRTPERLLGITAAHVIKALQEDEQIERQTVQVMNAVLPQLKVIDMDEGLDLATFEFDEEIIRQAGKTIIPLKVWPPQLPTEKCGILIGGYPRISRVVRDNDLVEWGILAAIGIADQVFNNQIIWTIERVHNIKHPTIPDIPNKAMLGGISGGPLIALLQRNGIHYWALAGIVTLGLSEFEAVVAKRADVIGADGKIDSSLM